MKRRSVVGLVVAVVLSFCSSCGRYEDSYASIQDAERDGAVSRGWVPKQLPNSGRQLTVWHDLDTNRCFGKLKFSPSSDTGWEASLQAVHSQSLPVVEIQPDYPNWWPDFLSGKLEQPKLQAKGFRVLANSDFFFVISDSLGEVYYWAVDPMEHR